MYLDIKNRQNHAVEYHDVWSQPKEDIELSFPYVVYKEAC